MNEGMRFLFLVGACRCCLGLVQAQVPQQLSPIWENTLTYGASAPWSDFEGAGPNTVKIAYDPASTKLYRIVNQNSDAFTLHSFNADGSDSGSPDIGIPGLPGPPGSDVAADGYNRATRLIARNDTITALTRSRFTIGELWETRQSRNIMDCRTASGGDIVLYGTGTVDLYDALHDPYGTLLLVEEGLRGFGPLGWPLDTVAAPGAERMALLGDRIVLGTPAAFKVIDRSTLEVLDTLALPSTGLWRSFCMAHGTDQFLYAAYDEEMHLRAGLMDLNSGSIWDTTLTLESNARVTAVHADTYGKLWVGLTLGLWDGGRLIEFTSAGEYLGYFSYRSSVHDISSSPTQLFLAGISSTGAPGTYVAAFGIHLLVGIEAGDRSDLRIYPNPACLVLYLRGLGSHTTHISVTDALGRLMFDRSGPFSANQELPVQHLGPGSYVLRTEEPDRRRSISFVIGP